MTPSPVTAEADPTFYANIQLKVTERAVDRSDMSWDCARCTETTQAPGEMVWLELEGVGNWAVCIPCWAEIAEENKSSTTSNSTDEALAAKLKEAVGYDPDPGDSRAPYCAGIISQKKLVEVIKALEATTHDDKTETKETATK